MTDNLEQSIRDLFAADATQARLGLVDPDIAFRAIVNEVRRRHQRRRRRLRTAAVAAGAAVIAVVVLLSGHPGPGSDTTDIAQPSPPARTGAVRGLDDGAGACKIYSPRNTMEVVHRSEGFAFDGTVTAIGEPHAIANRYGEGDRAVSTTFAVQQWYRTGTGNGGPTITVEVPVGQSIDPGPPAFQVGTRLLVSGSTGGPRNVYQDGWLAYGCGFTRYYDPATAQEWADAAR